MKHPPILKHRTRIVVEDARLLDPPVERGRRSDNYAALWLVLRTVSPNSGDQSLFTQGFKATPASRGHYRSLLSALGEKHYVPPDVLVPKIVGRELFVRIEERFESGTGLYRAITEFLGPPDLQCRTTPALGGTIRFCGHLLLGGIVDRLGVCTPVRAPTAPSTMARPRVVRAKPDQGASSLVYLPPLDLDRLRDRPVQEPEYEEHVALARGLTRTVFKVIAIATLHDFREGATRRDQNRLLDWRLFCLKRGLLLSASEMVRLTGVSRAATHRRADSAADALPVAAERYDPVGVANVFIEHAAQAHESQREEPNTNDTD